MRTACFALLAICCTASAEDLDFKKILKEYVSPNLSPARRKELEAAVEKIPADQRKAAAEAFGAQLNVPQYELWANPLLVKLGKDAVPILLPALKGNSRQIEAASYAICQIGPAATDAIPTLKQLFKDPVFPNDAPPELQKSAEYRKTKSAELKYYFALALGGIGEDAAPFIFEMVKSPDSSDRAAAAHALGARMRINDPMKRCLPVLLDLLDKDPDSRVRCSAASILAGYGKEAKAALPNLLKLYNSADPFEFSAAENAIREIDGKLPPRPLVKDERLSDEEFEFVKRCRRIPDEIQLSCRQREERAFPQSLFDDKVLPQLLCTDLAEADEASAAPKPIRGYVFRVLKGQGPKAKGGEHSYIKEGKMTEGFALLAYPQKADPATRHAFMLGMDGVVYTRELVGDPKAAVAKVATFNPDEQWSVTKAGEPRAKPNW